MNNLFTIADWCSLTIVVYLVVLFIWLTPSLAKYNRKTYAKFRSLTERKGSRQLKIINKYRKQRVLRLLHAYYEIDKVAKSHCYYLAKHKSCNYDGFSQRAAKVRVKTRSSYVAENCFKYPAKEYKRWVAEKLVDGWMESAGHRQNLMNPQFSKIGIGILVRHGYVYATQIFSS